MVTREEAIKALQVEIACMREFCMEEPKISEAYELAIAALREQESAKNAHCTGCRWKGVRPQRCSCCRRNIHMKDNYEV